MSVSIGELVGTVTLEDEFSSAWQLLENAIEKGVEELEHVFGGLVLGAGAVVGAVTATAAAIAEMAEKGSELKDIQEGFERLSGSAQNAEEILGAMKKGVAGTIDEIQLMQIANKALASGATKTAEQFGAVTTAARVLSREGFGPITQQINIIERALATGRTRQLQYMTGVIDLKGAEEKYAASLGVTAKQLSATGKLHADQAAIYAALNKKVQEAGEQQLNFAEKLKAVQVGIKDWTNNLLISVSSLPSVNKAFDNIQAAILRAFGGSTKTVTDAILAFIDKFATAVGTYGPIIIDWMKQVYDNVVSIWHAVQAAWDTVPDWFKNIARDAALAAGATYLVTKGFQELGGSDVLGSIANIAQIWSVLPDLFGRTAKALETIKILGFVGSIQNLIQPLSTLVLILGSRLPAALALTAGGFATIAIPIASLTAVLTASYNAYKLWAENRDRDAADQRQAATDAANLARLNTSLGTSYTKLADAIAEANKRRNAFVGPQQPSILQTHFNLGEGGPSEIKAPDPKKIEEATKASIDRTTKLWDEWAATQEKLDGDILASKLSGIQRWYDGELATLNKSKATNKNYWNELTALDEVANQKRLDAQKTFQDDVNKIAEDAAKISQQAWEKEQDKIIATNEAGFMALSKAQDEYADLVEKRTLTATGYQISQINKWLDAQLKAFPIGAAGWEDYFATVQKIAQEKLRATGDVIDTSDLLHPIIQTAQEFEAAHQMIDPGKKKGNELGKAFGAGFKDGIHDIPTSILKAIEGGGSVAGAIGASLGKSIGESIQEPLQKSIEKGTHGITKTILSGLTDMIPLVGELLGPLFESIAGKLKDIFGGPSKQELAGRKTEAAFEEQFKNFEDMANSVGKAYATTGKTLEQAREDLNALLAAEKQGPEAVQAIIDKLQGALDQAKEIDAAISGLDIKSHDELQHAADIARLAYEKIAEGAKTGQYTAEDVTKAYRAFQQALADMGDEGAKAWLKIHGAEGDAAKSMEDIAKEAGYSTREELQKSADEAERLFEYMRDSGKFTADQIEDAFKKAQDAAIKASGISQKLLDKQKSLQDAIAGEAPEAEMGSIEKAQRAELDQINKQIDAAMKAGQAQADAAAESQKKWEKYSHDWNYKLQEDATTTATSTADEFTNAATTTTDHFNDAANQMKSDFTSAAQGAAAEVENAFAGIEIRIPIYFDRKSFDLGGAGEKPEAAGEFGFAPGPMAFRTQGNEFFAFGGEGQGFEGLANKLPGGKGDTYVMQTVIDGRMVKESVFKQLEQQPTDRDKKILQQVVK